MVPLRELKDLPIVIAEHSDPSVVCTFTDFVFEAFSELCPFSGPSEKIEVLDAIQGAIAEIQSGSFTGDGRAQLRQLSERIMAELEEED